MPPHGKSSSPRYIAHTYNIRRATNMDKVRLGMIGVGGVGASRLDEALKTPEAEVVAICDVNEKNLAAAAEKCPGVPQFKDAAEMLANAKVDAVMLVVPHFLHAPMAIQVLERGA